MRCLNCRRTGFTETELAAHEKKLGHRRAPAGTPERAWRSGAEFAPQTPAELSATDAKAAIANFLATDEGKTWLKAQTAATAPSGPAASGGAQ